MTNSLVTFKAVLATVIIAGIFLLTFRASASESVDQNQILTQSLTLVY